jgi:hypothetical protein
VVSECIPLTLNYGSGPSFGTLGLCRFVLQHGVFMKMNKVFFHFFSLTFFLILYDKNVMISYDENIIRFEI